MRRPSGRKTGFVWPGVVDRQAFKTPIASARQRPRRASRRHLPIICHAKLLTYYRRSAHILGRSFLRPRGTHPAPSSIENGRAHLLAVPGSPAALSAAGAGAAAMPRSLAPRRAAGAAPGARKVRFPLETQLDCVSVCTRVGLHENVNGIITEERCRCDRSCHHPRNPVFHGGIVQRLQACQTRESTSTIEFADQEDGLELVFMPSLKPCTKLRKGFVRVSQRTWPRGGL